MIIFIFDEAAQLFIFIIFLEIIREERCDDYNVVTFITDSSDDGFRIEFLCCYQKF